MTSSDMISLKEIIYIFAQQKRFVFVFVFATVVIGSAIYFVQPVKYKATLLLDIVRIGEHSVGKDEYTYDEYYRIKADEQIAETVSHWLKTPRVAHDILHVAAAPQTMLTSSHRQFVADRISPQSVQVVYYVPNPVVAQRIATAIAQQINARIASLNHDDATQGYWFAVHTDEPIVKNAQKSVMVVVIFLILLSLFLSFWIVLLRHYWRNN